MIIKFNEYILEAKLTEGYDDYIRQFNSIYSLIKDIGGTVNPIELKAKKSFLKKDIDAFIERITEDNISSTDIDKIQQYIKDKKKLLHKKLFNLFENLDNIKRDIKRKKLRKTQERFVEDNPIINGLNKIDTLESFYNNIETLLKDNSKTDVLFFLYGLLAYFNNNSLSRVDLFSFISMHDDEMTGNLIRNLNWEMATWDDKKYDQWHYIGGVMNQLFRGTDKFTDTDLKEENPYTDRENAIYEISDEFYSYIKSVLVKFVETGQFDLI